MSVLTIAGLGKIISRYDAVLIDAWGVLHDGGRVFPEAHRCLELLANVGKAVIVVSNAARRHDRLLEELDTAGIGAGLIKGVMSSGELSWQALRDDGPRGSFGRCGYYLGPERSHSLCAATGKEWVSDLDAADFVLNTGAPLGNPETTAPLEAVITSIVQHELPMLCANPDQVAIRGGRSGISAGAIATRYLELGGPKLVKFGKPDRAIFERALRKAGATSARRALVIGDGLATDILGANRAGLDSLLIASGIHRDALLPLNSEEIAARIEGYGARPDYVCKTLQW